MQSRQSQSKCASSDDDQPQHESYAKILTVRDLLTEEPVGERLDSAQDHFLEFISYLRPVLKGNMMQQ